MSLSILLAPLARGAADDERRALREVERRLHDTRQDLQQARQRLSAADRALRDVEVRIGRLHRRMKQLDQRMAATRVTLNGLEDDIAQRSRRLERQLDLLRGQLRAAYAVGRQGRLKLLLSQDDASRTRRLLAYHGYLSRAREQRIARIQIQRERLEELQQRHRAELNRLERDRIARQDEQHALEAARQRRAGLLAEARKAVGRHDSELKRLEQDRARLRALLERIEARAAREMQASPGEPFLSRKGRLPWPVKGSPRASRDRAGGVFIPARAGAPVRAIHRGRVVYADWLRGYGLLTILDHGDGYMSLYGHSQALFKEPGQWVEAGEIIASAGDSGGKRDAGVYFAIRKQGKAVDPRRWCSARARP